MSAICPVISGTWPVEAGHIPDTLAAILISLTMFMTLIIFNASNMPRFHCSVVRNMAIDVRNMAVMTAT